MELRRDQFAYMITAAHLIHSKVDLHPGSHSFRIPPDECEFNADKSGPGTVKTNKPGNWHTACHIYTGRFL